MQLLVMLMLASNVFELAREFAASEEPENAEVTEPRN